MNEHSVLGEVIWISEKKSVVHGIYLKFIKENGTVLYFFFLRPTFFFSFQGYNIVFLKKKKTIFENYFRERPKETCNWLRLYYFLSLTAPSEKQVKASMLTKTWENKKHISAAYSFNFCYRQC